MRPTWRALRTELADQLRAAGSTNPDNEARFIVEEVSGYAGAEWLDVADGTPRDALVVRARTMADRRIGGEPLQYVLGSWSFRGLELMIDPRVLIPRPETEWVVEAALEEAVRLGFRRGRRSALTDEKPDRIVVDLGTGSGAIAIALEAELGDALVWATDVSADALDVTTANIAGNAAARVRVAHGAWFSALPDELRGRVDLIVTNPPYVAEHEVAALPHEVVHHEPRSALVSGPAGTEAIDEILRDAPEWLATTGTVVCEIAPSQREMVVALALDAGFAEAFVRPDLTGRPRALVARRGGAG